jgi:hypothetical protein
MVMRVAAAAALAVMLTVSTAGAQESQGSTMLELTRDSKPRPVVRPEADPGQASREAEKAAAEHEQQQRDEALMRQQTRPAFSRPDLGYDVTSGIQQRNLRR